MVIELIDYLNALALWIGWAVLSVVGICLTLVTLGKIFEKPQVQEKNDPTDSWSWGFEPGDFVYFAKRQTTKKLPEDGLMSVRTLNADTFYAEMVGTEKQRREAVKKAGYCGGEYPASLLDGAKLATEKDNRKIQRYLKDYSSPEAASSKWERWQKRIKK